MVQDTGRAKQIEADIEGKFNDEEIIYSGPCFGVRHVQAVLLFLLVCMAYCMRVNLSVGIVAMTNSTANPDFPEYQWTDKSIILSSFFWGYVIPQIGAGQLAKNYGARWLLIIAMMVCSLFTVLIPEMAKIGSYGVMICRAIQGFVQGFFYPCVHNLLSKWVPPGERTRLVTFVYAGGPFGTVIAMPITGWICASSIGWPGVFYVFGALGFLWTAVFIFLGANSVHEHKSISKEEKEYIISSLGEDNAKEQKTPWKDIFSSSAVWAILIAHSGQNWGFWTLLTEIPLFMNKVLHYDIAQNGLLCALPYFVLWVLSFFFGAVSDLMINRNIVNTGNARKINTVIGMVGPAAALIGLGAAGSQDSLVAITLLVCAVGINAATYSGYQVNHIDLSPTHAGTLMGFTNGVANIFSIIAPLSVQYIVEDESDPSQWEVVFYAAGAIYLVCSFWYCVYGSGQRQPWDSSTTEKK